MGSKYALEVKNVSKSFRLPTEQASGIKQAVINQFKGIKGYKEQHVLKDISFKVEKGDFFGIVGRNGSGKSTLLKIISQIYTPESGSVKINGTLVPFIELGVGFNPELTGRENVYMNGALLGFSKEEVSAMYPEIVEFAELEEFMDQKLKNYSSGMQVRLAFSIAIKAQGDILVLDEVLAVGDEAFQRKCSDFFEKIKKDKTKTVILVTHSMNSVKKYCNKAILIKEGKITVSGNKDDVANQYTKDNLKNEDRNSKIQSGKYEIGLNEEVTLLKNVAISNNVLSSDEEFEFETLYEYIGKKDVYIAFSIIDVGRGGITYDSGPIKINKKDKSLKIKIPLKIFNSSDFKIISSMRIRDSKNKTKMIAFTSEDNSLLFSVRNSNEKSSYALLNRSEFKIEKE